MTTATGQYDQSCYNCGQRTGVRVDNTSEIEILGSCCADLPPIWDMGANGLYGTDAGVGRRDREGYILEFGDDAYDENNEHEDCNCYDCRFEYGELRADEVHDLTDDYLDTYNDVLDRRGLPGIVR